MRAWQLDKIRRALHSYRVLRATNGKPISWRQVLDDIPASPGSPDLELEALRRFAVGINKTFEPPDKLQDIVDFLIVTKLLTVDAIAEDSAAFAEAVTIHNTLANLSHDAAKAHCALASTYRAVSLTIEGEAIELRLVVEPPGTVLGVEEEYRFSPAQGQAEPSTEAAGAQKVVRKGYGVSLTDDARLNFFVRGADRTDLVHYVALNSLQDGLAGELQFLRYGAVNERVRGASCRTIRFAPEAEDALRPASKSIPRPALLSRDLSEVLSSAG